MTEANIESSHNMWMSHNLIKINRYFRKVKLILSKNENYSKSYFVNQFYSRSEGNFGYNGKNVGIQRTTIVGGWVFLPLSVN